MRRKFRSGTLLAAIGMTLVIAAPSYAAGCGNSGAGFDAWLDRIKSNAAANGISQSTLAQTLSGVTYDPKVVRLDRSQRSFKLSFEQFYARRVSAACSPAAAATCNAPPDAQPHRAALRRPRPGY